MHPTPEEINQHNAEDDWEGLTAAFARLKSWQDESGTPFTNYQRKSLQLFIRCIEETSPTEELFIEALETAWVVVDEIESAASQVRDADWRKDVLAMLRFNDYEMFEQCFGVLASCRRQAKDHLERIAELEAFLLENPG